MDARQQKPEPHAAQHDEIEPIRIWWRKHGNHSLVGTLTVLAIMGALLMYRAQQRREAEEASVALSAARSIEQLESVVGKYAGTKAGISARLLLAKAYYDAARYPLALESYDSFLSDHPTHLLADVARVGRGHSLEALNRFDESFEVFAQFVDTQVPGHFLYPQAIFGQARVLALRGQRDEAAELLEGFRNEHAQPPWDTMSDMLLETLDHLSAVPVAPPRRIFEGIEAAPETAPEGRSPAPVAPVLAPETPDAPEPIDPPVEPELPDVANDPLDPTESVERVSE